MGDYVERTAANQLYTRAHVAQYKDKDLLLALALYKQIIATYHDEKEAGYSRSQIRTIASKLVPRQLSDA